MTFAAQMSAMTQSGHCESAARRSYISGHRGDAAECPLSGVKETERVPKSFGSVAMLSRVAWRLTEAFHDVMRIENENAHRSIDNCVIARCRSCAKQPFTCYISGSKIWVSLTQRNEAPVSKGKTNHTKMHSKAYPTPKKSPTLGRTLAKTSEQLLTQSGHSNRTGFPAPKSSTKMDQR